MFAAYRDLRYFGLSRTSFRRRAVVMATVQPIPRDRSHYNNIDWSLTAIGTKWTPAWL